MSKYNIIIIKKGITCLEGFVVFYCIGRRQNTVIKKIKFLPLNVDSLFI